MKQLNQNLLKLNIEKIAQYDFDNNKIFGSAYCVIQNDNEIYKKCFGTTSNDSNAPVTGDTLFRLASMTKPIHRNCSVDSCGPRSTFFVG